MQWQDLVFSIGNLMLSVALIPTVTGKSKPELSTSIMTAIILFLFGLTFATLSLWFSAVSISVGGTIWTILAFQRLRQIKK